MKGESISCGSIEHFVVAPIFVVVGVGLFGLICFILTIAVTWLYCKIFSKAGYCWALGLLTLVPIVNVIMLCILGIGDWPVLRELRRLKQEANAKAGAPGQMS